MPTFLRNWVRSTSGPKMSWPSMLTSPSILTPSIRSFMRFRVRSSVDLPQPEGPIKAVMVRRWNAALTSFKAWKSP